MVGAWFTRLVSGLLIASTVSMFPVFCAQAQTFWVFNHGVSDSPEAFNYLTGNLGLGSTQYRSINFSDPNWETTQYSLIDQARRVNRDLNLNIHTPGAKNLILVGHSQGGLRTRQFLQREMARTAPRPGQRFVHTGQVKGLALIGAPNYGAAAAANYPGFINQLEAVVAITLTYTVIGVPLIGAVTEQKRVLLQNIGKAYDGRSLPEMKPGSPLLNQLNNIPGCTTRNSVTNRSVLWVVKQIATSSTNCGSGGNSGFGRIPSNTYVMNIVGQNSSLESAGRTFTNTLTSLEIGAASTILAAAFWAAAFPTFGATIPIAIALTGLAILMLSLQLLWNGMIGSDRHDILISEDSQELKNRGIGGRFLATRRLPQALHADISSNRFSRARDDRFELRSGDTLAALRFLNETVRRAP